MFELLKSRVTKFKKIDLSLNYGIPYKIIYQINNLLKNNLYKQKLIKNSFMSVLKNRLKKIDINSEIVETHFKRE